MERPDWNALGAMFEDVKRVASGMSDVQKKMLRVTGEAWSADRMIKAVVGPRGHLIELEIDPRVFRKPDSKALAASIVATTRKAVEEASRRSKEILDESLPSDLRRVVDAESSLGKLLQTHDATVREELKKEDA